MVWGVLPASRVPEREGLVESGGGVCRGDGDGGGGEGADGDSSGGLCSSDGLNCRRRVTEQQHKSQALPLNNYSRESFSHLWQFIMLAFHEQQRKEVYPSGEKLIGYHTNTKISNYSWLTHVERRSSEKGKNEKL
jgi:hypothetical protein